jgi:glycosyltransferase involved in cell wall biosynthesis
MIKRKIKILFIVPSLARAGAETQIINLINSLSRNRFKPYLLCYLSDLEQLNRLDQKNVTFIHCHRHGKIGLNVFTKIVDLINEEEIDIVHCTMQNSLFYGWFSRLFSKRKVKLVAAIHRTVSQSKLGEISDKYFYRWFLKTCDKIIFVCDTQKEYWIKKYPFLSKISCVIYNGIDTSYFNPDVYKNEKINLRELYNISDNDFVISCIANFRPEKSHEILLKAFSNLKSNTFLFLVGEGRCRPIIEKTVEDNNLSDRVFFLGILKDVRPVLAASDVTAIASTSVETFSMAMLESLSMGVPMVVSNIGGLREAIIPGKTGYLVPVKDWRNYAKALIYFSENKEKAEKMKHNCRELIIQKFSEQSMVKNTEKLFIRALRV